ncbi:MAG: aspartate aminotransferase family protein, partial [Spirochaetes bacterium]|nr:aspartate aminotransferase family protein [Spirochaetota bacterium]
MGNDDHSMLDAYKSALPNSRTLYEKASALFPNGVTHDLRYLEPFPVYIQKARGAKKWDVDGRE